MSWIIIILVVLFGGLAIYQIMEDPIAMVFWGLVAVVGVALFIWYKSITKRFQVRVDNDTIFVRLGTGREFWFYCWDITKIEFMAFTSGYTGRTANLSIYTPAGNVGLTRDAHDGFETMVNYLLEKRNQGLVYENALPLEVAEGMCQYSRDCAQRGIR